MIQAVLPALLGTLPVVAALILIRVANLPRSIRVRQYPMPFVAVAYAVAALVALYAFNDWIDDVLRGLFGLLPFLRDLYTTTWQYAIENTAVLVVFAIVKFALRRVFERVFQGEDFRGSSIVEGVYRYDPALSSWFVRAQHGSLRTYLRVFYIVSIVITVLLMAAVGVFAGWPGFAAISFPAIATFLIGELYFAVDGLTEREFRRDVLGEDDQSRRLADYAGVRDVLAETFGDRVIHDGVELAPARSSSGSDRLGALAASSEDVDRIAAGYFERRRQAGAALESTLVTASTDLMHGRSVVIGNPFYGDLTDYLIFPAYYHLLQYRKCLVITGRDAIAGDLAEWVETGLESISGVPDLWHVDVLSDSPREHLDVGVLRLADLHDPEVLRANDRFFRDVRYVILAEPARMLSTGQLGLEMLLRRCGGGEGAAFAAFDRNHDGLVDTLSHLLKTDLTEVVAATAPKGIATRMIWQADGPSMHGRILPSISRYLGVGTELAAVALKYQVSQIDWVGADAFPVEDMRWIAGQYYRTVNAFADLELSQDALTDALHARSNPWKLDPVPNRFLIVEDEFRNIFETIRLFSTRGDEQSFVNLLSEEYLLRDYMVDNGLIFAADPKAIPSIVPDYARTERNLTLRLVLTLRVFGLAEAEVVRELQLIGIDVPPVEPARLDDHEENDREAPAIALLRALIRRHTGVGQVEISKRLIARPRVAGVVESYERRYSISEDSALEVVIDSLRPAYFVIEDEEDDRDYVGAVLSGLVSQAMMPGQFVTHAGKYYEVRSAGGETHRRSVVLRRAADHIHGRRVYRPMRAFDVRDVVESDQTAARVIVDGVGVAHVRASIRVDSLGYIEMPSRSALSSSRETFVSGIPPREYREKDVLLIELPGAPAAVRRTVAVMMNELFVTLFPQSHPYIVALTEDDERAAGRLLDAVTTDVADEAILIVEDSVLDLGLIGAVERHWSRILEMIADYLDWESTPVETPGEGRPDFVAVFPDDTPEELAERARAAAEQDAQERSRPHPPAPDGWWKRVVRRIRGWFAPRRGDQDPPPVPLPDEARDAEPIAAPPTEVAPDADRPFVVDLPHPAVAVEVADGAEAPLAAATDGDAAATEVEPEPRKDTTT